MRLTKINIILIFNLPIKHIFGLSHIIILFVIKVRLNAFLIVKK